MKTGGPMGLQKANPLATTAACTNVMWRAKHSISAVVCRFAHVFTMYKRAGNSVSRESSCRAGFLQFSVTIYLEARLEIIKGLDVRQPV